MFLSRLESSVDEWRIHIRSSQYIAVLRMVWGYSGKQLTENAVRWKDAATIQRNL